MASIKERAAALNLAEKLSVRPRAAHSESTEPARSSMWSGLLSHLKSSLKLKRRRVHFKTHCDCFAGSEAVDVVEEHINTVKAFEGAATREEVVCVCRALLDSGVFEAVESSMFGNDKKQIVFQDTKCALYRFANKHVLSVDDLERSELGNRIQKLLSGASAPLAVQTLPSDSPGQTYIQVSFAQMLDSPVSPLSLQTKVDRLSLSPSRVQTDSALSQPLVDEVWQEQTLLRLLHLVELPLLEGVLQCCQLASSSPSHSNPDLIYSSNHLDRRILQAFRDSQDDEWLCAALHCLDFLPDQLVVNLSRELPYCFPPDQQRSGKAPADQLGRGVPEQSQLTPSDMTRCKMLLYHALHNHYSSPDRAPLLPLHMTDVFKAITDLLVNAKLATALEALQLCLKLLPRHCREELHRLLSFMALAADAQGIRLDKEMENRLMVKRSFSRAILHSKTLPKEKQDLMVVFMLSNIWEIFKIPGALHKAVSEKLAGLVQDKQPDVTGCHESSRIYAVSTKTTTNQELWDLLNGINLDPKMSAREKKRLLGQFYQAHPEIFNKYFGECALSVL